MQNNNIYNKMHSLYFPKSKIELSYDVKKGHFQLYLIENAKFDKTWSFCKTTNQIFKCNQPFTRKSTDTFCTYNEKTKKMFIHKIYDYKYIVAYNTITKSVNFVIIDSNCDTYNEKNYTYLDTEIEFV
jgi:hypothetical protein